MTDIYKKITEILDTPINPVSIEEAQKTLRDCGIFDEDNQIK